MLRVDEEYAESREPVDHPPQKLMHLVRRTRRSTDRRKFDADLHQLLTIGRRSIKFHVVRDSRGKSLAARHAQLLTRLLTRLV